MEKKIIENVKFWKYEAEIEEWMTEQNIAPESIEQYAYQFPNKFNLDI